MELLRNRTRLPALAKSHPVFMVFLRSNKLKANTNALASVDQLHQASRAPTPVSVSARCVSSLRNKLILAAAVSPFAEGDGKEGVEVGSPLFWVRNFCIGRSQ